MIDIGGKIIFFTRSSNLSETLQKKLNCLFSETTEIRPTSVSLNRKECFLLTLLPIHTIKLSYFVSKTFSYFAANEGLNVQKIVKREQYSRWSFSEIVPLRIIILLRKCFYDCFSENNYIPSKCVFLHIW